MPKYTPKLPLLPDNTQPGFQHIDNLQDLVRQNLKMVLLTNPGERVMLPEFGAGINSLLFENFSDKEMLLDLEGRIIQQINEYLPYIELNTVTFGLSEVDRNKIGLRVDYSVPDLEFVDILFVDLSEE
jgi:phage baseplate assembly protein W